jgi:DNA-3-methyladenine glycosylase
MIIGRVAQFCLFIGTNAGSKSSCMPVLAPDFFARPGVTNIARELVGKVLTTRIDGNITAGRIVETEAYNGVFDKACHAYAGRRTPRNETMYLRGGHAYVYICYGLHRLFNVVTNAAEVPDAVLIRALVPLEGLAHMERRTGKSRTDYSITRGPGSLSVAMGIHTGLNGLALVKKQVWLEDDGFCYGENEIRATTRIGVESAGADALLPYRFIAWQSRYVSARKK